MTRQKEELIKMINTKGMEIAGDQELSHSIAPVGAYESMETEIWQM